MKTPSQMSEDELRKEMIKLEDQHIELLERKRQVSELIAELDNKAAAALAKNEATLISPHGIESQDSLSESEA